MGFDKAKAIRAAEKYLAQGKIPAAIQEYQRIVEHEPDDFTALNTLGDLHARVDKPQEAVVCYRRVAEHYREQGFTLKAIAMYKKVTRFTPNDHQTALALATLYEQRGLMVDARAQYLVAADAYTRTGNTREALEVLRRIADLDPSNTQIRLRLAESYAREKLPDLAAEAYTLAGERLAARGEHESALEAFTKALALSPASHTALHGLLAAHTALGTADEAAEVLEQAVSDRPDDLEARALLARAHVESENALRAEQSAQELVSRDPSSFTLFFDVIRLCLRQGITENAARLLGQVTESALAGGQEATLTELLQEVLARDPEHIGAHHLLVRAYAWTHDEGRLRTALERLADTAEMTGAVEEERMALTRLARLAPDEPRYYTRLEELGGPLFGEDEAGSEDETPTFESFILNDGAFASSVPSEAGAQPEAPVAGFEWNTVAAPEPETIDASSSFADLNDLTDTGGATAGAHASQPPPATFQEFDFGLHAPEAGTVQPPASGERMLRQELESVDFYIEQGYLDLARDTLDHLDRQYGQHAEIDSRRKLLPLEVTEAVITAAPVESTQTTEPAQAAASSGPPMPHAAGAVAPDGGIDPGLAAIFDEFREAVEDSSQEDGADFETHYNLGLAYREMGLLDQAVEEFQSAVNLTAPGDGTPRYLQCCNLLGHCFVEKGMPRPAATWFKKGLTTPGHTEDEYQAMRYELAAAYEQMGDTERAIEIFSEVYAIDVSYRGVADRLRELQKTVNRES
jgi:tetratricopeptide (TPR) repeat protein